MPTDPLWIAIYISLTLSVVASLAVLGAWLYGQDTRGKLDRLVDALSRSGMKVNSLVGGQANGRTSMQPERPTETTLAVPSQRVAARPPLAAADPHRLLAPPPQVLTADGVVATGDWLQHYARPLPNGDPVTWPIVVVEFYDRLTRDDEVASYFYLSDTHRIRQHFALVMVKITRQGITVGDRETLRVAHRNVRNRRGEPITDTILNKVITTLATVLRDYGVPQAAIHDLGRMLTDADLRSVLVIEPART
jgi:hypothetical protein